MDAVLPGPQLGRRHEPRYWVMLDAKVRLPLADLDRNELVTKGVIENVSHHGACIHLRDVEIDQLPALSRILAECYLVCQLPDMEDLSYLSGDIAWVDVHADDPWPHARLGLDLAETVAAERRPLDDYVQRLAQQ